MDTRTDEEKLRDEVLTIVRRKLPAKKLRPEKNDPSGHAKEWPPCPTPEQYHFIGGLAMRYSLMDARDFVRRHLL